MSPYLVLLIAAVAAVGIILAVVALYGRSKGDEGRAETESDVLKDSQDAQRRAAEAAKRQRDEDEKRYL